MKPLRPNRKLTTLWHRYSPEQKRQFALHLKTTVDSLRQYVDGRRTIHPELAIKMEKASHRIVWAVGRTERPMPDISREDLSAVCAKCEYAIMIRQAKGLV